MLQCSLQVHVVVDLKTQDSQIVSSQSAVLAIFSSFYMHGLDLKVTSSELAQNFTCCAGIIPYTASVGLTQAQRTPLTAYTF